MFPYITHILNTGVLKFEKNSVSKRLKSSDNQGVRKGGVTYTTFLLTVRSGKLRSKPVNDLESVLVEYDTANLSTDI